MFMDRFVTGPEPGLLVLHGYGNVFERVLARGQSVLVEPGAFLYKDASVRLEVVWRSFGTGLFGSRSYAFARFIGPGRLGIQSMYVHHAT